MSIQATPSPSPVTSLPSGTPADAPLRRQRVVLDTNVCLDLFVFRDPRWAALQRSEAALRTVLGRMHVLDEYGRHAEVIALGERTVERLLDLGDEPSIVWLRSAVEENVGVACGLMSRHADAMGHYEHALAGYRAIESDDDVARVMANQGCELLDLGHARDAMAAFDAAREFFEADGEALWVAKVDAHRGQAALVMGQLATAVELLTSACTALGALDAVAERRRATAGLVAASTELRLVDEETRHGRLPGGFVEDGAQVVAGSDEEVDRAADTQATVDLVGALGVDLGLGQKDPLPPLLVVVRRLQERRRLAGVHRSVAEVQLRHGCVRR